MKILYTVYLNRVWWPMLMLLGLFLLNVRTTHAEFPAYTYPPHSQQPIQVDGMDTPIGSSIAFDSSNRPYFTNDRTGVLTGKFRTLRNGLWHDIDYSSVLTSDESIYPTVVIDNDNALYATFNISWNPYSWRLLYSPDITASSPSFHAYKVPDLTYVESNMSHGDNSVPPAIISWSVYGPWDGSGETKRYKLRLYIPTKNSDGTLSLSDSLDLASAHAEMHWPHSGGFSPVVSKNGKIHVAYLSELDENGIDTNSSHVWVATVDRATKHIDYHAHLSDTHGYGSYADNHSMPVIGITSTDTVHVVLGTHGNTFPYWKATTTNTTSTLTNQNSNVPNRPTLWAATTYVDLVIDDGDTLHTSYRTYGTGGGSYKGVGYSRRPRGATTWDNERILLAPAVGMEGLHPTPLQHLFMDRQSGHRNIYLTGRDRFTDQSLRPFQWFAEYPTPLIATTNGGSNWSLTTRYDLLSRINNGKTVQRITFSAIPGKYPNEVFDLNATTDAGLTVSYELVSGPATLTGSRVTVGSGTGEVVIKAKNSGDATYYADEVTQRFQVDGTTIHNLAQDKAAYQSGTLGRAVASLAVDGNTAADSTAGQISHTRLGSNSWWEVDLGSVSYIDNIEIYNRTDAGANRLSNYHVFISDVRFTGTTVAESQAQSGVADYHQIAQAGSPTTISNINRTGRYIRVQLRSSSSYLHMGEVKVNGTFSVPDTTPDAFAFTAQNGVQRSATVTSNAITVSGINTPASISASGGTLVVDGSDFTGTTVTNGQTVAVTVTASASFNTRTTVTVTIGGVSAAFSVTTDENRRPTAEAGTNQTVDEGDLVTLSGSGTDPENDTLTYSWRLTNSTTVSLSSTSVAAPTFTAPNLLANEDLIFELTVSDGNSDGTDTVTITVEADNDAPTAEAGDNKTVAGEAVVSLSGGGTDPEGKPVTYSWRQTAGSPSVSLAGSTTKTPSFTAPKINTMLTFTLTVSDGDLSGTDTVTITVQGDNTAPTAEAGTNQTVDEGDLVTLSGSGTHPQRKPLSYSWRQTSGTTVTLSSTGVAAPTFTAPNLGANEDLVFELTVSDGSLSGTDTVTITVEADNDAPTAEAGNNQTVDEGDTVTLSGSGTDPENDTLSYSWRQTSGTTVTLSSTGVAAPTFTAPNLGANEDLVFELTVSDGSLSGTDTVTITVEADNDAPTAEAGNNQTVAGEAVVSLSGSGTDPENDTLTYSWRQTGGSPSVSLTGSTTQTASFIAPKVNTALTFTLTVSDGDLSGTDTVTITVQGDNTAPTAAAGTNQTVDEGDLVTLSGSGTHPQRKPLTYSWRQTSGTTVTLSSTGVAAPTFTAPNLGANEDLVFELTVSDGSLSGTDTVTITVEADNDAPTAAAGTNQTVDEGDTVTLSGSGTDPEGQAVTYSWRQTSGATVALSSTSVAAPTFTAPNLGANEDLVFELTVSDGRVSGTATVTITVEADNDAPTAAAGDDQTVDEGDTVTLSGSGTDPEGESVTYAWRQTSGTTVTLSSTGVAAPTFTAPNLGANEDLVFELTVSDGSLSGTDTVTITVEADNDAPTAAAGTNQTVDEGDTVTLSGSGTDPEGQAVTYSWRQTSGATVALSSTSVAAPTFTAPNLGANEDLVFELTVSDGRVSGTATVTITVEADNDAPTAAAGDDQTVDEGDTVTLSGSGTDPEGESVTYAWRQTSGTTVTLSSTGVAAPTFTAPNLGANEDLVFELTVSDGRVSGTATVTITVEADNDAPTAAAGDDQTVDEGDTVTLSGSGTDPEGESVTYAWRQTSGTTVTLSSTSVAAPTFTAPNLGADADLVFELTVSDGSVSGTATVTITVEADNDAPTAAAGDDQTVDEGDTVTLSGSGTDPEGESVTYSWRQTSGTTVTLSSTSVASPTFTAPNLGANEDLVFELTVSDGDLSGTATVTITVEADNDAPTAAAGDDQTVDEGDTVTLSGSGTDPEGESVTYAWRQTSGTTVTLSSTGVAAPTFTAPNLGANEDLVFELTVSDGDLSGTATVTITVEADNDAPTAAAGDDQTVDEGDTVTLSGSGTDPEGESVTYAWRQTSGATVTLSSTSVAAPTFTAPNLGANEDLVFELTVSDGDLSGTATVTITVEADNDAPTAEAGNNQTVDGGDTVTLSGSGTDPEGQAVTYAWRQTGGSPSVSLTGSTTQTASFTAPNLSSTTTLTFTLTVSDGSLSGTATVTITVEAADTTPDAFTFTAKTGVSPGTAVTSNAITVSGIEAAASITVSSGGSLVVDGSAFTSATVTNGQKVAVTVTASASFNTKTTATVTIGGVSAAFSVTTRPADTTPDAFTFTAKTGVSPGTAVTSNAITVSGIEAAASITVSSGGSLVVDGSAFTSATITNGKKVAVTVTASASFSTKTTVTVTIGGVSATFSVTTAADQMPTFGQQTIPNQTWTQHQAITAFTLPTATGGDGAVTYGLSPALPAGVTRNTTTHQVAGTPSGHQAATTYTWTATDSDNDRAELTFTVAVDGVPTAAAGDNQTVDEGDTVTLSGSGTDPEGESVTYSWRQTSGKTVSLSSTSVAAPTFTAPNLGADADLVFELTVSDGRLSGTATVTITVEADNDAPTAEAGDNQTVDEGDTVTLSGSGTDPEGQAVTYSWRQTSGTTVTLSSTSVAAPTFTAPNLGADADLVFELTVSDGSVSGTDTVTITVEADNDAPTAEAGDNQTVDEGDLVTLSGSGTDPEGQAVTYSWRQTSGTTVTLSSTSVAAPTFTAPNLGANEDLVFELTVSDGSVSGTDTVTITVEADNDAPTAAAGDNQTVDEGDLVTLSGSGTDPEGQAVTYSWRQTSGTTVTLSSTGVAAPTFTAPNLGANEDLVFELTVSDGSLSGTDTVTITVEADNDAPTADAGTNQTVDGGDTVTLSGSGTDPEGQAVTYSWRQTSGATVTLSSTSVAATHLHCAELRGGCGLGLRVDGQRRQLERHRYGHHHGRGGGHHAGCVYFHGQDRGVAGGGGH